MSFFMYWSLCQWSLVQQHTKIKCKSITIHLFLEVPGAKPTVSHPSWYLILWIMYILLAFRKQMYIISYESYRTKWLRKLQQWKKHKPFASVAPFKLTFLNIILLCNWINVSLNAIHEEYLITVLLKKEEEEESWNSTWNI